MGAWDVGVWDNDDASDWLADLCDADGTELLESSLKPREVQGYYLEAPEGTIALCAADVVLLAVSPATSSAPRKARAWVESQNSDSVRALSGVAKSCLTRLLAPHSELQQLWEENAELYPAWKARVEEMRDALGG